MRLGLIGDPQAAVHYATVSRRMPELAFTAVVAETDAAATAAAESVGAGLTVGSVDELLQHHQDVCDAVVIHQPVGTAERSAQACAAAGKHVLLGAPMAASSKAANVVIDACRSAGVTLMAGHSWRFRPSHIEIKKTLEAGSFGVPGLVRVHVWRSLGRDTQTIAMGDMVEALDLVTWLFNAQPTELYGVGRPGYVQVHCGFPGDGMAVIDCANAPASGGDYFSCSLIGSTGAAYADDHHNRNLLFTDGPPRALESGERSFAQIGQLAEFAAAIQEQRPPSVSGADGQAAITLAEVALSSLKSQRPASRKEDGYEIG